MVSRRWLHKVLLSSLPLVTSQFTLQHMCLLGDAS